MKEKLIFGLGGFKATTPVWAAKASNYLLIATVTLFILNNLLVDWSDLIPQATKMALEAYFTALEKTLTTIATALRFLGVQTGSDETAENSGN